MYKNRIPKKPVRPKIPVHAVKSVVAKRILMERDGEWDKKGKKFKVDLLLVELLNDLPLEASLEDLHLLVESYSDGNTCNFMITFYAPEEVKNPNYKKDKREFEMKIEKYKDELADYTTRTKRRKKEIKTIIRNEVKPRKKELEEEIGLTIKKNRGLK